MPKRTPGLQQRGGIWHIDKRVKGYGRLCESTGTGSLDEAERLLARRLEEIRQAVVYGVRPERTFRLAAAEFLVRNLHKRSISNNAIYLEQLDPWIGALPLNKVHDGTLKPYVDHMRAKGRKNKTINTALETVRRLLNQAASWIDEHGLTWIERPPKITLLPLDDARAPYPLSWDEQDLLLRELSLHLARMALFKVNTGTREDEVCQLRWDWEVKVPELQTSVFIIPAVQVKNGDDRVVVLNSVAQSVIEECRGHHPVRVFAWKKGPKGKYRPTASMNNNGWQQARTRAAKQYQAKFGEPAPWGFANVRVHDLKHTFGRRLRSAGVAVETRKVLLGHRNGDITTHYSAVELTELIEAANRICARPDQQAPALVLLKRKAA